MKILLLTNKPPYPPIDGGTIATYNLAQGLFKAGAQVSVLAMYTPKHPLSPNLNSGEKVAGITMHFVFVNTHIRLLCLLSNLLFSRKPYIAQRFISAKFREKLRVLLQSNQFDIVQLEGLYLCPYIPLIRSCSKAKITFRSHNVEHEIWKGNLQGENNNVKRLYLKILYQRLVKFETHFINEYDALIPISRIDEARFKKMGNNKPTRVLPAGFFLDKTQPSTHEKVKSLFFIGSLDWRPNIEGLIWFIDKVWKPVKEEFPELDFHIAGRNAHSSLKKILSQKNVIFHGEVEDAFRFFQDHSLMVVPLFSGSGMRVKIIEGMAAGKTIITTTTGAEGIDYLNEENIILADDEFNFIQKIEAMVKHPDSFKKIGKNGSSMVRQNYDNYSISINLLEFYRKLI